MYSDPPPHSQFRRPWSPEAATSSPYHTHFDHDYNNDAGYDPYYDYSYQNNRPLRQPSDPSVEALDLADYAATMRPQQYQTYYQQPYLYPPSPSLQPPPSLLSRGGTLSSATASTSSPRRPFSLPPPSHHSHSDIDVARFPQWSRNWYKSSKESGNEVPPFLLHPTANPDYFDPGYSPYARNPGRNPYDPPESTSLSYPNSSNRDPFNTFNTAPWNPYGSDPPSYHGHSSVDGAAKGGIDTETKEARMRLLEREFGGKNNSSSKLKGGSDFLDENGKPLVGTVDSKGNLVTQGPRKRFATRMMQIILALTAAIPSIYAAMKIKPDPPPPPAMKPPVLILYVFSIITAILLLYLFLFRPCCCGPRKRGKGPDAANPLMNGMMVLPVPGMPGGGKKKHKGSEGGKKGKKGKFPGGPGGGGDVQVNLIVDPGMFGGGKDESSSDEDEMGMGDAEDDMWSVPGGYTTDRRKKKRKGARRRSVFAGLAMEAEWKRARKWLKKVTAVDAVWMTLWGAEFVLILIGKRCPSGGFEGWCNAYNVSSAAACLLCVAFGVSLFFDVKDLSASKSSPRTRT